MKQINNSLGEKAAVLIGLLEKSKQTFETVAQSIDDTDFRKIIARWIKESTEYIDQLKVNLKIFGINDPLKADNDNAALELFGEDNPFDTFDSGNENEIFEKCCSSQIILEKAYLEVLLPGGYPKAWETS